MNCWLLLKTKAEGDILTGESVEKSVDSRLEEENTDPGEGQDLPPSKAAQVMQDLVKVGHSCSSPKHRRFNHTSTALV